MEQATVAGPEVAPLHPAQEGAPQLVIPLTGVEMGGLKAAALADGYNDVAAWAHTILTTIADLATNQAVEP